MVDMPYEDFIRSRITELRMARDVSEHRMSLELGKWAFTLFFGVMYMLAEYGTFKMANNITFNKLNAPEFGMIVAGAIISAIGMLLGSLCNRKRHNLNKEE